MNGSKAYYYGQLDATESTILGLINQCSGDMSEPFRNSVQAFFASLTSETDRISPDVEREVARALLGRRESLSGFETIPAQAHYTAPSIQDINSSRLKVLKPLE